MALTITDVTIESSTMGSVAIVSNQVQYTPDAGFSGKARGTYTMTDGAESRTARWVQPVTGTGTRANHNTFTAVTQGAGAQLLDVLANDVDGS